jgi:hypothetical protein
LATWLLEGFCRIDAGCSEAFELVEFSPVPG